MRLFLAVEPDPPAREQLGVMLADLRRALGEAAMSLRWIPPANLHATVHFLGEVDGPGVDRLRLTLARVRDRGGSAPGARALREEVGRVCEPIAWHVDHVTLFQSDLSGPSPRYTPLAILPLAPRTP